MSASGDFYYQSIEPDEIRRKEKARQIFSIFQERLKADRQKVNTRTFMEGLTRLRLQPEKTTTSSSRYARYFRCSTETHWTDLSEELSDLLPEDKGGSNLSMIWTSNNKPGGQKRKERPEKEEEKTPTKTSIWGLDPAISLLT